MTDLSRKPQKIFECLNAFNIQSMWKQKLFLNSIKLRLILKNDQTLLVQHLRFACQAKCLTVWPRQKTLPVKHFWLASRTNFKNIMPQSLLLWLGKQCYSTWSQGLSFRCTANLKCWTNNVRSFGQARMTGASGLLSVKNATSKEQRNIEILKRNLCDNIHHKNISATFKYLLSSNGLTIVFMSRYVSL